MDDVTRNRHVVEALFCHLLSLALGKPSGFLGGRLAGDRDRRSLSSALGLAGGPGLSDVVRSRTDRQLDVHALGSSEVRVAKRLMIACRAEDGVWCHRTRRRGVWDGSIVMAILVGGRSKWYLADQVLT